MGRSVQTAHDTPATRSTCCPPQSRRSRTAYCDGRNPPKACWPCSAATQRRDSRKSLQANATRRNDEREDVNKWSINYTLCTMTDMQFFSLDVKNAFNVPTRDDIAKAMFAFHTMKPFQRLFHTEYSESSELLFYGSSGNLHGMVNSTAGVRQG